MSETPNGTFVGTFTAPAGDRSVNFKCAVVAGTSDNTPPVVRLLDGAPGTISVGPIDANAYPVTISGLAWASTNVVQVSGDSVDDCYFTVLIGAQPIEQFTVDPATITFSA